MGKLMRRYKTSEDVGDSVRHIYSCCRIDYAMGGKVARYLIAQRNQISRREEVVGQEVSKCWK